MHKGKKKEKMKNKTKETKKEKNKKKETRTLCSRVREIAREFSRFYLNRSWRILAGMAETVVSTYALGMVSGYHMHWELGYVILHNSN